MATIYTSDIEAARLSGESSDEPETLIALRDDQGDAVARFRRAGPLSVAEYI